MTHRASALAALSLSIVSVPSSAQTPEQQPSNWTAQDFSRFAIENGCVTTVTRKPDRTSWANTVCGGDDGQPTVAAAADGANGRSQAVAVNGRATAVAWHQCTRDGRIELRSTSQGDPLYGVAATIAARIAADATRRSVRIRCQNTRNSGTEIPLNSHQVIRPSATQPAEPAERDVPVDTTFIVATRRFNLG